MKKIVGLVGFLLASLFLTLPAGAVTQSDPYQIVRLVPGWNIISTPRPVASHTFSNEVPGSFDILLLDQSVSSSAGGWVTMADLNQTEFTPLYGYFINNKTGVDQTLTFTYKTNLSPNEKLLERKFTKTGWYSFAPAHTDDNWVMKQCSGLAMEQRAQKIFKTLENKFSLLIPFDASDMTPDYYSINPWFPAYDWDELADHSVPVRELQGYAMYVKDPTATLEGVVVGGGSYWGDICDDGLYAGWNREDGNNPMGDLYPKQFIPGSKDVKIASFQIETSYDTYTVKQLKLKTSENFPFENLRVRIDIPTGMDNDNSIRFDVIESLNTSTEYAFDTNDSKIANFYGPVAIQVYADVKSDAEVAVTSSIELSGFTGSSVVTGREKNIVSPLVGQETKIATLDQSCYVTVEKIGDTNPSSEGGNLSIGHFKISAQPSCALSVVGLNLLTTTTVKIENLKLYDEQGRLVGSIGGQVFPGVNLFTLSNVVGTTTIEITADVTNLTSQNVVVDSVLLVDNVTATNEDTNISTATNNINLSLQGLSLVGSASLTLVMSPCQFEDANITPGSQNVCFSMLRLNSENEGSRLESLKLKLNGELSNVSDVRLYSGDILLSSSYADQSGIVSFNDLNIAITKDWYYVASVKININNEATVGTSNYISIPADESYVTASGASSGVSLSGSNLKIGGEPDVDLLSSKFYIISSDPAI